MNDHARIFDRVHGPSKDRLITPDQGTRIEFMGVPLDALSMDETVARCRELARGATPSQHVVLNAAKVVSIQDDPKLREIISSCALVNADGQAVVWAAKLLGHDFPERVTGIDLFERLVAAAAADGDSIFLLGAEQSVLERTAQVLRDRNPGLTIAGMRNGFWKDDAEVIAAVREAQPNYLFLAIPSPRKEYWLNTHLAALGVPFVMGVGGSFDVVAGKTSRAPKVLQKLGLEWTWRLIQEPRRMFKRYWKGNTAFIRLVLAERKRGKASR